MLIGSITPYYTTVGAGVDHYVYTDNTGAEYRLDQNNGGTWSNTQGLYMWFDATANILHFKNGTFWVMACTSGGQEADAGTLYPTTIEDPYGNQVIVTYDTAAGLPYGNCGWIQGCISTRNTSSRITAIEDARANNCGSAQCSQGTSWTTYYLTYSAASGSPIRHLTSVGNLIGTGEACSLTYSTANLNPPFGSDSSYSGWSTVQLTGVTTGALPPYQFWYDSAGASELTSVIFPYGGEISWGYNTFTYSGSRLLREVSARNLTPDSAHSTTPWTYTLNRPDASNSVTMHTSMTLTDASGVGAKTWNFITSGSSWQLGLISEFIQKASANGTVYTDDTYTWTQNPAGNPYISSKTSVADPGTPKAQSALSTQTLDQYGNITQAVIYPYNNTTTPLKMYNNTYRTDSAYIGYYLRDRLLTATLTTGGVTRTLAQNFYDGKNTGQTAPYPCGNYGYSYITTSQAIQHEMDPNPLLNQYTGYGVVTASITPAKTACVWYYTFGKVSQTRGSDGSVTSASADAATNYAVPQTISTQSYGESITYNSWLGVNTTTGWNGEQLSTTYDSYARPITATSAYGASWTFGYSPYVPATLPIYQTKTGPDGFTRTTLDGLGHTIKTERGQSEVDTVYAPCACSPLGKVKSVTAPFPAGGSPAGSTVYTYDGIGRTVSVVQPDGASTTFYSYSGNQTTVTDPAGKWKTFTNDVEGNLVTVTEPDPANPTAATLTTSYTYDWMKHLTGVSMTRGGTPQTRTFVYDDAGRLTSATNPENGTVLYYYNNDNTLQYKRDAKGQDTVYTYDAARRVTMIQRYPTGKNNAEDTCQRVTYTYDANLSGSTFSQYSAGRLTAAQYRGCAAGHSFGATELYSYHPAGAMTGKRVQASHCGTDGDGHYACPTASMDVTYTYDSMGQISSVLYPYQPGPYVYGSDSMGRHVSLSQTWNSGCESGTSMLAKNVQFDYAGRMTSMQYRAAQPASNVYDYVDNCGGWGYYTVFSDVFQTETRTYNVNSQLTQIAWSGVSSSTFNWTASTIQYAYSASQNNGQIMQMTDSISGETVAYQYDALKRLVSACSSLNNCTTSPTTFQYDGFGNLTSKTLAGTTTPIAVNAAANQLSNASYDANGNMYSGAGATLTYDVANRVTSSQTTSGGSLTEYYGYAPDNKRMWRLKADGTEELTLYGARGEKIGVYTFGLIEEIFDNLGNWTGDTVSFVALRTSVWFDGRLLTESGNPVLQDRLGTNRANSARFYPYGEEITSTSNDRTKFGTYTRDGFTGLDYADQRYYASAYGNFTTPDPSMNNVDYLNPASWNAYSYTMGDPINGNDPSGLQTCGQTPIVGGVFNGQTVGQVLTGTSGNDLLAQTLWLEGGTIYSSDLASAASETAYAQDLLAIGTAVLNQLDVDDGRLSVYQNGRAVCPLGQCLDRNLQQVILALEKDNQGSIFDSGGHLRSSIETKLQGILNTNIASGPLVQDTSGNWVNQGCEGLFSSVAISGGLLSGAFQRVQPNGLTLLFWNKASASSTTTFPGNAGYTGWRDDRSQGETFWGLSSTPPIRRPPPPRRRPL